MCLAFSYYGLSNDSLFLKHINLVDDADIDKHFWLALYYLRQDDFVAYKAEYDTLTINNYMPTPLSYLDSMYLYRTGNYKESKKIMEELYGKLNSALLKDLSQEIINR